MLSDGNTKSSVSAPPPLLVVTEEQAEWAMCFDGEVEFATKRARSIISTFEESQSLLLLTGLSTENWSYILCAKFLWQVILDVIVDTLNIL